MKNLALILFLIPFLGFSQELKIKKEDVRIGFIYERHRMKGKIGGFNATIKFDLNNLSISTIKGTADVNTIETGNKVRDAHFKSEDFFDVDNYPTLSFESTRIVKNERGFSMEGIMTIKGVERKETIVFTYENNIFTGEAKIFAGHYKMKYLEKKKPEKTPVTLTFTIPVI